MDTALYTALWLSNLNVAGEQVRCSAASRRLVGNLVFYINDDATHCASSSAACALLIHIPTWLHMSARKREREPFGKPSVSQRTAS